MKPISPTGQPRDSSNVGVRELACESIYRREFLQAAGWAEAGGLSPRDVDSWFSAAINYALGERHRLREAQRDNGKPGRKRFTGIVPTHEG